MRREYPVSRPNLPALLPQDLRFLHVHRVAILQASQRLHLESPVVHVRLIRRVLWQWGREFLVSRPNLQVSYRLGRRWFLEARTVDAWMGICRLSRRGGRPTDEALPSRVKEGGQMQGSFEPS